MINKDIILHLSLIPDIASGTIKKILSAINNKVLTDLYQFCVGDFVRIGISESKAQLIVEGLADKGVLEKEYALMAQHSAEFVSVDCDEYPALLKQIDTPPAILYYQGDVELFKQKKMLACVGARKAHGYARDCLNQIVKPLVLQDWVVVSGGAMGADAYAHQMALDNGGKTIAVVGSGLCYQYPSSNKRLFKGIVESGGLIVSSFAMGIQPEARCFPIRNRIISGLSVGCLVLQAASKSGALITAQFSLEQGREVFAVPGSIYDPLSAGCHDLIKQGAKLVGTSEDIQEEFSWLIHPVKSAMHDPVASHVKVSGLEQQLLQVLVTEKSVQDLVDALGVDQAVLHDKLFDLSLEGVVEQGFTGLWKRV